MLWYVEIDRQLADMPNYRLEQLERDFDPAEIRGRDLAKVERELQLQMRAGNELAKRRQEAKRSAERQADEQRHAERETAQLAILKDEFRRQARMAFPGSEQEFNAVFDRLWQEHQIEETKRRMAHQYDDIRARYQGF